ncbi:hypothetical protein Cgig2_024227 [Carnegiea gigantea]|uniref:Protein FAR1-RELATED SEQUENCE n=1 Tax=Carnegiea gigantea TaxID=171969 RepID=A0A9Q1K059_9CARY|nr:hypothetical protein Cgig2_024227 [Carnegiea gigantea]
MDMTILEDRVKELEDRTVTKTLFDAESLDIVVNEGDEDMSSEYTFLMFEKEFIDGAAYNYKLVESSSCAMSFEVWGVRIARKSHGDEPYEFRHIMFREVKILCFHCLRVLHACYLEQVSDKYITRRWCKGIKDGQNLDLGKSTDKEHMGCFSVWKMQMMRKTNSIITAS